MEIESAPAQFDIWTSILSKKQSNNNNNNTNNGNYVQHSTPNMDSAAATYVHPLVKRSSSSLSDESLQICTESLGSETGSDICFSSSEDQLPQLRSKKAETHVPSKLYGGKLSTATTSKSFPPPLTSLCRTDAPSIRMHSHRQNGRLVLEAVSIPSQNYFNAERHHGRLTLTFANNPNTMEEEDPSNEYDDEDSLFDDDVDEEEAEQEEAAEEEEEVVINCYDEGMMAELEMGIVAGDRPRVPQVVMNNLNYKKVIRPLANVNPTAWLEFDEQQEEDALPNSKESFLVMAPQIQQARLNVYENCWKGKTADVGKTYMQKAPPVKKNFIMSGRRNKEQKVVIVNGGGINDGCKDNRTSFLFWESYLNNCVV